MSVEEVCGRGSASFFSEADGTASGEVFSTVNFPDILRGCIRFLGRRRERYLRPEGQLDSPREDITLKIERLRLIDTHMAKRVALWRAWLSTHPQQ